MPSSQKGSNGVALKMNKKGIEGKDGNRAVLSSQLGIIKGMVKGEKRKRKVSETQEETKKEKRMPVKYIGETSRSGYERLREHYSDFENLSIKSHMLKHYIEKHSDIERKDMKFSIKVLRSYRSTFERQIGESVFINYNLRCWTVMMNSKNEYNRCIIPRLGINLDKDEWIEEYEENEKVKSYKKRDTENERKVEV